MTARATTVDRIRQGAVLLLAVAQVAVTAIASGRILEQVETGPRSLVESAGYAFAIWGPIFLLCDACAVWQALPGQAANPPSAGSAARPPMPS